MVNEGLSAEEKLSAMPTEGAPQLSMPDLFAAVILMVADSLPPSASVLLNTSPYPETVIVIVCDTGSVPLPVKLPLTVTFLFRVKVLPLRVSPSTV
jgi:hypothetical protein